KIKIGVANPIYVYPVIELSNNESLNLPLVIPKGIAIKYVIINVATPSQKELTIRFQINSDAGILNWNDSLRSPRKAPVIQTAYFTCHGSFSPNFSRCSCISWGSRSGFI